jgi:hypothetical protein
MESFFLNGGMIGVTLDYGDANSYILSTYNDEDTLVYVGGQIAAYQGTTSTSTITFNLTGGAGTTPLANDLVLVAVSIGANSNINPSLAVTGYTSIAELYAPDSQSADLFVGYKFMGTTPDTNFTRPQTGNTQHAGAYAIHVWRNADLTTPLDVTRTVTQGLNTAIPNPSAITPVTANTQIVVVAASAHLAGNPTFTASYLSNFITVGSADNVDTTIGVGNVAWTSGSYDPAAWTFGGTDSVNYSYAAATIALRPRTLTIPIYGNRKNSGVWNLEAAYDYSFSQYTPPGQVLFTTTGTQSWTVPVGITEISAVVVGGGGGGGGGESGKNDGVTGGAGGGLAYGTIDVTPGETLTIVVGVGGTGGPSGSSGTAGGASSIARGATVLLQGGGGQFGQARATGTRTGGASTGTEREGGGAGGNSGGNSTDTGSGGGGAGGYGGPGGAGGTTGAGSNGSDGGGGGGATNSGQGYGGGGAGVFGSGVGGSTGGPFNGPTGGVGALGGSTGTRPAGGNYGGGGGACDDDTNGSGGNGGQGVVRIVWGPGRTYPIGSLEDRY